MNLFELMKKTLLASMVAATLGLAGCSADGNGLESGGIVDDGGDNGGLGPNDGSTPTDVGEDTDGDGNADTPISGNFVCQQGARSFGDVSTVVGTGGLVGGALSTLVDGLAGNTVTKLLNSVSEPDNVVDGKLATYSSFALTLGLLGPIITSIDETVVFPAQVPSGNYAVFGVSFPSNLVDLTLFSQVIVTTFLGDTQQETRAYSKSDLDLLGLTPGEAAFVGLKAHKAFDKAMVRLVPGLLSLTVGDAMHVHELCTGGKFVTPPATN